MKSLYFSQGEHYLSIDDFKKIEEKLKQFPLEEVTVGDAGEPNKCLVGRLVEDKPGTKPKLLNSNLSKDILSIIFSEKAKDFIRKEIKDFSSAQNLFVRRAQFNLLSKGSFVGQHLDIDSNPNYRIAVVFQLGSFFEGGEFDVYKFMGDSEPFQSIKPEFGSICISDSRVPHAVARVKEGTRKSLVMFVSDQNEENPRELI
tara:strand:- start:1439 stop:2041 length:603 start_codon:yes stop_codon:yes gene_type:complete